VRDMQSVIMYMTEMRSWSSQPNKDIICQHISLYSRMVLVEEKNLTEAYPIRKFSFYMHMQNMTHPVMNFLIQFTALCLSNIYF
jgi:hypothetical protein